MRLVSEILIEDFWERIKRLNTRFQTFEGKKGSVISEAKIVNFISQFLNCKMEKAKDGKLLLDGIIRLLESANYINRDLFDKEMQGLLGSVEQKSKTIICPLGGEKDSAKHMMYYFNDILQGSDNIEIKQSLQECLQGDYDEIIFFDDGAYSGKQVISIFQEYFGIEDRTTKETHVNVLKTEEMELLKKKKILLAYICFNPNKKDDIIKELNKLGLYNIEIKFVCDLGKKSFEKENLFSSDEQKQLVSEKLKEIGFSLLKSTKSFNGEYKPNWDEDRVVNSSLGYNDSQQVIILKSSVPTYTITAFWVEDGIYNKQSWIPLFERTDK